MGKRGRKPEEAETCSRSLPLPSPIALVDSTEGSVCDESFEVEDGGSGFDAFKSKSEVFDDEDSDSRLEAIDLQTLVQARTSEHSAASMAERRKLEQFEREQVQRKKGRRLSWKRESNTKIGVPQGLQKAANHLEGKEESEMEIRKSVVPGADAVRGPPRTTYLFEASQPKSELDILKMVEAGNKAQREVNAETQVASRSLRQNLHESSRSKSELDILKLVAAGNIVQSAEPTSWDTGGRSEPLTTHYMKQGASITSLERAQSTPGAYPQAPGTSCLERAQTVSFSLVGITPECTAASRLSSNYNERTASARVALGVTDTGGSFRRQQASNDSLAVANAVEDTPPVCELPMATSVDKEAAQQRRKEECKKMTLFATVGALLFIIIVLVVAVSILATMINNQDTPEMMPPVSAAVPTDGNAVLRPPMENLELLYSTLPDSTKENVVVTNAPQALAWDWLLHHQNITRIPDWRKRQLFSLATFFHAFEGPLWPTDISKNWLNDSIDECSWINTSLEYLYGISSTYQKTVDIDFRPCNDAGEIQTLALLWLKLSRGSPRIPPELALLPSLSIIILAFNEIKAPLPQLLPTELSELTNFKVLVFHGNGIVGTIPKEIGMLTTLDYLMLGENVITGTLPTEVALLSGLKQLALSNIPIEGTMPSELGRMTKLTDLEISGNSLTGPMPTELGLIASLNELALQWNTLSSTIPSELGLCTQLILVLLQGNKLSGSIPSELGMLTRVTDLDLLQNKIHGSMPSEVGLMTSAHKLRLSNNSLTGSIPSELGLLTQTKHLSLNSNNFAGSIPSELWQLGELKQLDLSGLSLLSGTVPEFLCNLQTNASCYSDPYFETTTECSLDFDCRENLCGCSCECSTRNGFT